MIRHPIHTQPVLKHENLPQLDRRTATRTLVRHRIASRGVHGFMDDLAELEAELEAELAGTRGHDWE
jgi:hypothetical protein